MAAEHKDIEQPVVHFIKIMIPKVCKCAKKRNFKIDDYYAGNI